MLRCGDYLDRDRMTVEALFFTVRSRTHRAKGLNLPSYSLHGNKTSVQ